jgi:hypothetical protein
MLIQFSPGRYVALPGQVQEHLEHLLLLKLALMGVRPCREGFTDALNEGSGSLLNCFRVMLKAVSSARYQFISVGVCGQGCGL